MCGACVHDAFLSHPLEAKWPSDRFWLWIMVAFCSFCNLDHTSLSVMWTQLYFVPILKGLWEFCSLFCNVCKIILFENYIISILSGKSSAVRKCEVTFFLLASFEIIIWFLFCKYSEQITESPVSTQRSVYRIKHIYEPTERHLCFCAYRQTTVLLCLQTDDRASVPTDGQLCFCAYSQICFANLVSLFHL